MGLEKKEDKVQIATIVGIAGSSAIGDTIAKRNIWRTLNMVIKRYKGLNVAAIPEQMQRIRKVSPKAAKAINQAYHKSRVDGRVEWMKWLHAK